MTHEVLDPLLDPATLFVPITQIVNTPSQCYEKPAHLALQEKWIASKKTVPMAARVLVPTLNLYSQVPVAQIAFYLGVSPAHIERWIKASTGKRPLKHTKWRPELNLYDLLHIKVPE